MKTAGVLFSGGKDSSLAALLLAREYEVELNTFVFRENTNIESVENAAAVLGMPLIKRVFPDGFLAEMVKTMARDGFPNNAINLVHRNAICSLAGGYDVIGDGTRLNDRVPMLGLDDVQRIEARYKSALVRPLLGYPRSQVDYLTEQHFVVRYGETGEIANGDYEHEIRAAFKTQGINPQDIFPAHHSQSLVVGLQQEDTPMK